MFLWNILSTPQYIFTIKKDFQNKYLVRNLLRIKQQLHIFSWRFLLHSFKLYASMTWVPIVVTVLLEFVFFLCPGLKFCLKNPFSISQQLSEYHEVTFMWGWMTGVLTIILSCFTRHPHPGPLEMIPIFFLSYFLINTWRKCNIADRKSKQKRYFCQGSKCKRIACWHAGFWSSWFLYLRHGLCGLESLCVLKCLSKTKIKNLQLQWK